MEQKIHRPAADPGKNNSVATLVSRADDDETRFGMCGCYPGWMQRFARPKIFLVAFCIKNILQGMAFSYVIGIQTSMERHFKFDARSIGYCFILSFIYRYKYTSIYIYIHLLCFAIHL